MAKQSTLNQSLVYDYATSNSYIAVEGQQSSWGRIWSVVAGCGRWTRAVAGSRPLRACSHPTANPQVSSFSSLVQYFLLGQWWSGIIFADAANLQYSLWKCSATLERHIQATWVSYRGSHPRGGMESVLLWMVLPGSWVPGKAS